MASKRPSRPRPSKASICRQGRQRERPHHLRSAGPTTFCSTSAAAPRQPLHHPQPDRLQPLPKPSSSKPPPRAWHSKAEPRRSSRRSRAKSVEGARRPSGMSCSFADHSPRATRLKATKRSIAHGWCAERGASGALSRRAPARRSPRVGPDEASRRPAPATPLLTFEVRVRGRSARTRSRESLASRRGRAPPTRLGRTGSACHAEAERQEDGEERACHTRVAPRERHLVRPCRRL